jgi:hypothetical protein
MSAHAVVIRSIPRADHPVRKFLRTLAITALALMGATAAFAANGLKGDYYNTRDLTGPIVLTRTDATINSDWGGGSPHASINADNYSIRWTGYVLTTTGGQYRFTTRSDDGIRLWVAGQLVVDSWIDQGPTDHSGVINLAAGAKYDVKVEFYENGGGAVAQLRWTPPGGSDVVIPTTNLNTPEDNIVATPTIDPANALITTGTVTVSMATATPGAEIHYSTDLNTAPSQSGPLYTGPFTVAVSGPTYVTAQAFKDGLAASAAKTVRFVPGQLNFPTGLTDANAGSLQFNGDAIRNGTFIRLTADLWDQLSSVFSIGTVDITGFNTSFTFTQAVGDPTYVSDGMAFVIQNNSAGALGTGSSRRLGYFGVSNSAAIKFDVFKNPETPQAGGTQDPSNSTTGLYLNGAITEGGVDLLPFGINLSSGQVMQCDISYFGSTLTYKIKNTVTNAEKVFTHTIDLPAIVGGSRAYLGFTGTTGSVRTIVQHIRTWTYEAVAPALISGAILLQGSTHADVPLVFEFRPQDNSGNFTRTVTPAANGNYTISVPRKNYVISIKGSKWLRENISVNATAGDSANNKGRRLQH